MLTSKSCNSVYNEQNCIVLQIDLRVNVVILFCYITLSIYLHCIILQIDFERDCITPNCDTDLAVSAAFTDKENVLPVSDELGNNEFVFDSNRVSMYAQQLLYRGGLRRGTFSM